MLVSKEKLKLLKSALRALLASEVEKKEARENGNSWMLVNMLKNKFIVVKNQAWMDSSKPDREVFTVNKPMVERFRLETYIFSNMEFLDFCSVVTPKL